MLMCIWAEGLETGSAQGCRAPGTPTAFKRAVDALGVKWMGVMLSVKHLYDGIELSPVSFNTMLCTAPSRFQLRERVRDRVWD